MATVLTARAPAAAVIRAYRELTKPGITVFVGLTAVAGYIVSMGSGIDSGALFLVALSTMLMSGGAAALNQVAERDLDARMRRTEHRPLPAGLITVQAATTFGWTLTTVGALLAIFTLPPLTFVFLALCHISYVHVYTPLKRVTPLCTLVGAIPGSLPVLAGAAAAGGMPGPTALALTALLFTWQIPHFFAIGWLTRDDYARAGFCMLPVTDESGKLTARAALLYAVAMQGFAILVTREAAVGPLVMAVVHTAGTAYVFAVLPFLRRREKPQARRLFLTSLLVLPIILSALMVGLLLRSS